MQNPAEREQTAFDRFSDRATNLVSRLPFLLICMVVVGVWAVGWAIDEVYTLHHFVGDVIGILTLLLVVFLQNSERRAEYAIHRKLDAISTGLQELIEHEFGRDDRRVKDLREAVSLEEEV
jgi:low affinity Fe/Cu permease